MVPRRPRKPMACATKYSGADDRFLSSAFSARERRRHTPIVCATVFIFVAIAGQCYGADWLRIRTPHLEVLTDAGEKTGRTALNRLDDIRRVLEAGNTRPLPLRVVIFASEKEFRAYAGDSVVDGFYQSGVERDFIVLHAGANL